MQKPDLNVGARSGLVSGKHIARMGQAVWLFLWCLYRQTQQRNGTGLVLRGLPLSYADIAADMSDDHVRVSPETVRNWMSQLRAAGYIAIKHSVYSRLVIRVLKAKKFSTKQLSFPQFPQVSTASSRANLPDIAGQNARLKEERKMDREKERAATRQRRARRSHPNASADALGAPRWRGTFFDLDEETQRELLVGMSPSRGQAWPQRHGDTDGERM